MSLTSKSCVPCRPCAPSEWTRCWLSKTTFLVLFQRSEKRENTAKIPSKTCKT